MNEEPVPIRFCSPISFGTYFGLVNCNAPNIPIDSDQDGMIDDDDNDGIEDAIDNCSFVANPDHTDTDGDVIGDACDDVRDDNGVPNSNDNCPNVANPDQNDFDHDGIGDVCDRTPVPPLTQVFKNQGQCIEFADANPQYAELGITKDNCKNAFKN